jgi:predicted ATPase/DNA-binding SARP family transcriptional activator
MPPRLTLFGPPSLEIGGRVYPLSPERRHQLVALLALKRAWVGRAELAALLWPRQATPLAYTNLRKTLYRLQPLAWAAQVEQNGNAVRFEADVDVHDFETALRDGRLADALALRRGDLLAGFEDADNEAWTAWLGFERERLRAAWRTAALERLAQGVDAGEALRLTSDLLEMDALDEAALSAQMNVHARQGQVARARQAYQAFAARLEQELGIAPGSELQAEFAALAAAPSAAAADAAGAGAAGRAPGAADGSAAGRASSSVSGSVARAAGAAGVASAATGTSAIDDFVGRSDELRRIAERLAECRLLNIIGPGGMGKTRLARRVLAQLGADYPDGAAFVALDDLSHTGDLGPRIARELGLGLSGGQEPLEQVMAWVRARRVLLVLDNFEHLVPEAAVLQTLLDACPQLKVIVTSRVRLSLPGENLFPLEGLPCPDADDEEHLESFDAVRLFVRAARRVEPALVPAAEAAAIVDICRQVDGMPLALELAAAWTRVLSCEAIAEELRSGSELVRSADATRSARHASLEGVFDQSWRLLSAGERAVLARLSVFHGGFTPEAARAVAGAALPMLGALADKSLLRKDSGAAGASVGLVGTVRAARGLLHPMLRQLAAGRLDAAATAATRAAHAQHFHRLLAVWRPAVENGERKALDQVEVEFENCRAAWDWAIEQGAAPALTQSAPALMHYCDLRGHFKTGMVLLEQALASPAALTDAALATALRAGRANLAFRLDRYAEARDVATAALAEARRLRDTGLQAQCLSVIGASALRLGRHDDARRAFEPALKAALAGGHRRRAAAVLHNLALIDRAGGQRDAALVRVHESMASYRELGDVAGEAMCLTTLATLQWDLGELQQAIVHLKEALVVCDRHGLDRTRTVALSNLAALAIETGDHAAAKVWGRRALEIAEASGNRHFASWMRVQFAQLAIEAGDLAEAREELKASLQVGLSMGLNPALLESLAMFAQLLAAQGERRAARRVIAYVIEHPTMAAPDAATLGKRLTDWAEPGAPADPPCPQGLAMEELAQRIVVETAVAHAPLIALLRG